MRRVALLVCLQYLLLVSGAYAGPANRRFEQLSGTAPQPVPVNLYGFGAPLPTVAKSALDLQIFATGQINFKEIDMLPNLGPVFNSVSCAACHSQPAIGGGGLFINEIRVRNNTAPGPLHIFAVDNMLRAGPQSQGGAPIFANGVEAEPLGCQITAPGCAPSACQKEELKRTTFHTSLPTCDPTSASYADGSNCSVGRAATPLFGFGLVEAVADQTLIQLALNEQASSVPGLVKQVMEFGQQRVGRFGWKDDHATLRGFAGDAYLNEIGITNPDNPNEVSTCALNQTQFGVLLQANGLEDSTDPQGRADVDRFADFMRALDVPPTLAQNSSAQHGAALFGQIGCAGCHTPSLTTAPNPASIIPPTTGGVAISSTLNSALANRTFHPYSDFLLHDMGSLGDGITSGSAGPTQMRTAPLWGIRAKSALLHDGRAADIPAAIGLHGGQGKMAAGAFQALSSGDQQDLVNFLDTL